MDWIITTMKNWFDDLCANCKPNSDFKQYFESRKVFGNLIEEHNFFEELEVDGD